jgi:hypothetical protein
MNGIAHRKALRFVAAFQTSGVVLLALFGAVSHAGETEDVRDILAKAVAKSKGPELWQQSYETFQNIDIEKRDEKGKIEDKKKLLIEVISIGDEEYQRLIKINGEPLKGDELKDEQEKEREFREELAKGTKREKESYKFAFDENFVKRYDFILKGTEVVQGRTAYVLSFEPKKGVKEEKEIDQFLSKTRGTLWIDSEEYAIAQAETTLIEPIKILGGIVASIKDMQFVLIQKKEGNFWLPDRVTQNVVGRKMFSKFDMRVKVKFEYRKKNSPS